MLGGWKDGGWTDGWMDGRKEKNRQKYKDGQACRRKAEKGGRRREGDTFAYSSMTSSSFQLVRMYLFDSPDRCYD